MTGPLYAPGFWMHETSGVLRPAIIAYLAAAIDPAAPAMSRQEIAAMRVYLRQWIAAPTWIGPMIDVLRSQVEEIASREDIDRWLDRALEQGIDPL